MFGFIYILSSTCKVFFCKKNEGGRGSDNYENWLGSSWVVVQKVIFRWNNILYQIFSTAFAVKRYFQLATFNWPSRSSVHPFPFHILFLTMSGHQGIGLVGDNQSTLSHDFLLWVLKSYSHWTKITTTGSQVFSGRFQMFSRTQTQIHFMISDVHRMLSIVQIHSIVLCSRCVQKCKYVFRCSQMVIDVL